MDRPLGALTAGESGLTPRIGRRDWLGQCAAGLAGALALSGGGFRNTAVAASRQASEIDPEKLAAAKREYLQSLLCTREDIDAWLARRDYPFCKYDPELGYLHVDRDFPEGQDGSICSYRYDRWDARRTIAHADQPCRINTYGNSFTSCEQVSDGETWQEVLAAHLGEPLRNFGIGGYSVYQAYLRMKREEARIPARCIVFNIFDDDHYRNLHGWQRVRFGINRRSPCPPVPHVKVDLAANKLVECANPCPTAESLNRLCDLEGVLALFGDDYMIDRHVRRKLLRDAGVPLPPGGDFADPECTARALYATNRVVEKVAEFARASGRKLLFVLSYGAERIKRYMNEGIRFDQPLVDFLEQSGLAYVDLLAAHAAEFKSFSAGLDAYLARYYIGHYNPQGNFFCAFALKEKLVPLLNPPPPAYVPAKS